MTASKKPKEKVKEFISSRQWAEDCLVAIKQMQDDFLDRYHDDKPFNKEMLTLLNKLVGQLEKRL